MVGPEQPQLPASAAEQSRAGRGRSGGPRASGIRAPTGPRGALQQVSRPRAARWGPGGGASMSARANLRTRLARLPFVVCTCVCARACVRECACVQGGGGAAPRSWGFSCRGGWRAWATAGGGAFQTPVFRVGARGAVGAASPSEMANFVSGFSAANKCLPDSRSRRTLIDTLLSVLTLFFSNLILDCIVFTVLWCAKRSDG